MISFYENHSPQEFGPQIPNEEEIISLIKDYGLSSSEATDTLYIWLTNKQKEHNESESVYSQLKFNMEVSNLYLKAGLIDEAYKYCNQAWNYVNEFKLRGDKFENEFLDICRNILELSDNIDKKYF